MSTESIKSSNAVQIANEEADRTSYLIHKVGVQAIAAIPKAIGTAFRAAAEYRSYLSDYLTDQNDPHFRGSSARIYKSGNWASAFFKKIAVSKKFRSPKLSPEEIQSLKVGHSTGATSIQVKFIKGGLAIELLTNAISIGNTVIGDGVASRQEMSTFVARMVSSACYLLGMHYHGSGNEIFGQLENQQNPAMTSKIRERAYRLFNVARQIFIIMNIAQIIGGTIKLSIELYNAATSPKDFSLSALIDGGLFVGMGGSWLLMNRYYAHEAARYASNPATLNKAIDILRVHAIELPTKILWMARGVGMIGPLISASTSTRSIYQGIINENSESNGRWHHIVSGVLGLGSSVSFGGFAYFLSPATLPIGVAYFSTGLALLAAQTVYDEWDSIVADVNQVTEDVGEWWDENYEWCPGRLECWWPGSWL